MQCVELPLIGYLLTSVSSVPASPWHRHPFARATGARPRIAVGAPGRFYAYKLVDRGRSAIATGTPAALRMTAQLARRHGLQRSGLIWWPTI
jgi:hypothetical protein